jgi:hypothetical protein
VRAREFEKLEMMKFENGKIEKDKMRNYKKPHLPEML